MTRTRSIALPLLSLTVLSGMLTGCYERVVSAHGFGADRMAIHNSDSPQPVKATKLREPASHKPLPSKYMRER